MSKLKHLEELNKKISMFEKQLEQYQSLVKTVDPDNLPAERIIGFSPEDGWGEMLSVGKLELYDLERDFNHGIVCRGDDQCYLKNTTHYILESDLIKLIKGDL